MIHWSSYYTFHSNKIYISILLYKKYLAVVLVSLVLILLIRTKFCDITHAKWRVVITYKNEKE